jgi:hypothetical protein
MIKELTKLTPAKSWDDLKREFPDITSDANISLHVSGRSKINPTQVAQTIYRSMLQATAKAAHAGAGAEGMVVRDGKPVSCTGKELKSIGELNICGHLCINCMPAVRFMEQPCPLGFMHKPG